MIKTFHHYVSKVKNHKYWESQLFFNKECFHINFEISFSVDNKIMMTKFFDINIFGLIVFELHNTKQCHHAGTNITLGLFGFGYELSHIDSRHWDDDKQEFISY